MNLTDFLEQKRAAILDRWFDIILQTYPEDTRRFLKRQKNRFANPVAHEIIAGMEGLLDQLASGSEAEEFSPFLDKVIRIRAVQDFSPSEALGFIFALKDVVRAELSKEGQEERYGTDLSDFDRSIDEVGLLSLDLYTKCREKVYELRIKEVKNQVGRLLEKADLICKNPEISDDLRDINLDLVT